VFDVRDHVCEYFEKEKETLYAIKENQEEEVKLTP
jgi:hypothetical protein